MTLRLRMGSWTDLQPCATARRSETTATAVGSPPAPWPEKTTSPPKRPLKTTMFCVPCDQAIGERSGTSMGATRAWTTAAVELRRARPGGWCS